MTLRWETRTACRSIGVKVLPAIVGGVFVNVEVDRVKLDVELRLEV
jgi:hypothetical protein